jgi:hypothetical protein
MTPDLKSLEVYEAHVDLQGPTKHVEVGTVELELKGDVILPGLQIPASGGDALDLSISVKSVHATYDELYQIKAAQILYNLKTEHFQVQQVEASSVDSDQMRFRLDNVDGKECAIYADNLNAIQCGVGHISSTIPTTNGTSSIPSAITLPIIPFKLHCPRIVFNNA